MWYGRYREQVTYTLFGKATITFRFCYCSLKFYVIKLSNLEKREKSRNREVNVIYFTDSDNEITAHPSPFLVARPHYKIPSNSPSAHLA